MRKFFPHVFFYPADGDGAAAGAGAGAAGAGAGAAGAGAGGAGSSAAGPGAGAGAAAAGAGAAGAGAGTGNGTGGAASRFEYPEDRSQWVDPRRYSAAERATNAATKKASDLERDLQIANQRIQALAGVTPQNPLDAERQGIIDAFLQLFPAAKFLTDEKLAAKFEAFINGGGFDQAAGVTTHHWETHRDQVFGDLRDSFMDELNVDELSPEADAMLVSAFLSTIPNREQNPEGYNAWRMRYERRDPKLIEEFVTSYRKGVLEPARRQAVAGSVNRIPRAPQGGPRRPVAAPDKPKINFGNLDEVIAAAHADPRMQGAR